MPTLWLKFPEEVIASAIFSAAEKDKLEEIFSIKDRASPWNLALASIGVHNGYEGNSLLFWHRGVPYFNWSALASVISGGAIHAVPADGGGYALRLDRSLRGLLALARSQWKIARFLQKRQGTEPQLTSSAEKISESIALGLVLQSLMMRLGSGAEHLPKWLSGAEAVPAKCRKTVRQIQAVQLQRTKLSHAWREFFPCRDGEGEVRSLPEHFWDQPEEAAAPVELRLQQEEERWSGLPVCAGKIAGMAVVIDRISEAFLASENTVPRILVFRRARPETTELFQYANGIVFAEGGVLSHACVVAREMNIPAVTGLGAGFYTTVKERGGVILAIDGGAGTAEIKR